MASVFKIGITQNINCDNLVGFPKSGHILGTTDYMVLYYCKDCLQEQKVVY